MAADRISERLKLDHFKVYKQHRYEDQRPRKLTLKGQFDRRALAGEVDNMYYFANVASKNGSTVIDKNAHLAFYELRGADEPRRFVAIRNQFGLQRLLLGRPYYLLAPSEKVERGSAFPKGLDHFKAYQVLRGEPVQKKVRVADQYDREYAGVAERPAWFCVPVEKKHGDNHFPVQNPRGHLTFYSITPQRYKIEQATADQFGKHKLLFGYCVFLGVPTLKLDWARA